MDRKIYAAVRYLQRGGIVAYPTEAVFGLGCDPHQQEALQKLLLLKQRDSSKGMIVVAANFEQLLPFIDLKLVPEKNLLQAQATWPGPYTWLFPAQVQLSPLLTGQHATIAVRVTAFMPVRLLCQQFGSAIISTSANRAGQLPARTAAEVQQIFQPGELEYVVDEMVGGLEQPTEIRDVLTQQRVR